MSVDAAAAPPAMAVDAAADAQLTVRLVTKLPAHLRVPDAPLAIPAAATRYGLSQVVNSLLDLSPPMPFDFLVAGQLLRDSLASLVAIEGLSAEETLEVEYVPAVLPPKPGRDFPQDEWVSALASADGLPVTGSYDGMLRLWSHDAMQPSCAEPAHGAPVSALCVMQLEQQQLLASGALDGVLALWRLPSGGGDSALQAIARFSGHADGVTGAAASAGGELIASSGWDGTVQVWDVAAAAEAASEAATAAATAAGGGQGDKARRKRKGGAGAGSAPARAAMEVAAPVVLLEGHSGAASCVAWAGDGTAASGGWDHSLRLWDVGRGAARATVHAPKAVYCIAARGGGGSALLAWGGADNALRLWDERAGGRDGRDGVRALASHKHWVGALAWRPGSDHMLASGGHDGAVKVWDTRAAVPLATLPAHSDKVLAVAWLDADRIASGGADCRLQTFDMTNVSVVEA